jgi:hypothetical protein
MKRKEFARVTFITYTYSVAYKYRKYDTYVTHDMPPHFTTRRQFTFFHPLDQSPRSFVSAPSQSATPRVPPPR